MKELMSVVVSVLCVVVADAAVELYPFAFPAGAVGGVADRSATLLDRTIDARGFVSAVGGRFVAGGEEIPGEWKADVGLCELAVPDSGFAEIGF